MTEKILKGNVTGVLAALFVCAPWGSLFPMIKVSYTAFEMNANDIPAILLFAGVRFFVSGILIFLFRSVKRKRADVPKRKNFGMIFWVALIRMPTNCMQSSCRMAILLRSRMKMIGVSKDFF